jgi:para-aminobenzoate synthetase component 1
VAAPPRRLSAHRALDAGGNELARRPSRRGRLRDTGTPPPLELDEPRGAFAALEEYLAAAGFWGRQGVVAELYLGYGLSEPLRRLPFPPPPEPCRLPLLACRIRPAAQAARPTGRYRIGEWQRSWDEEGYTAAIEAVRAAIARGEVYQTNLVQHLSAPFEGDPEALAGALAPLRPLAPRPFAGQRFTIVSASPELFLRRRGRRILTAPIKGTRPAGVPVADPKDAAEHVMIVDLERNDLARVCEPGSISWPELAVQRELAGVTHLESRVEGRLRAGTGLAEILEATFPGGSITGAPKIAALDLIAALEPVGRGASMGALGVVQPNGDLDLALTIRTFAVADGRIHLWVGGGIVWDSDAASEIEESWVKARPLLAALGTPPPA